MIGLNNQKFDEKNKMKKYSATVFGATGLVGKQLVEQLAENDAYEKILVANRRKIDYENDKITSMVIDFNRLEDYASLFEVNHLFICLGTTIKKAGSKENFKKVDFELPKEISKLSAKYSVDKVLMISSIGANAKSSNFYTKTKGEAEEVLKEVLGDKAFIVRPSMLLGDRKEFRFGEEVGKVIVKALSFLIPKKYKGIYDYEVARAMIKIAQSQTNQQVFESDELKRITQ